MQELIAKIYAQFCKETRRSGGILVASSIGEWHRYLAAKLDEELTDNGEEIERLESYCKEKAK
jgi:hypothetical protein